MRRLILLVAILVFIPSGFLGAARTTMDTDLKVASKFALYITEDRKPKGRCACLDASDDTADHTMGVLRYSLADLGGKTRITMECWVPEYAYAEVIDETFCEEWVTLSK
jgi:hypothetical protein